MFALTQILEKKTTQKQKMRILYLDLNTHNDSAQTQDPE